MSVAGERNGRFPTLWEKRPTLIVPTRADAAVVLDSTFGALPGLGALNRDFWDRV